MKVIFFFLISLLPLSAPAASVMFQFSTTVDVSRLGGRTDTPLKVVYSFDNTLPEGFGFSDAGSASYGPVSMVITLGTETITASGAELFLWNNGTSHMEGFPPRSDGYAVNANGGVITGQLLGATVHGFMFEILDFDQNMFDGRPDLPLTTDFASAGDYQITFLYLGEKGTLGAPPLAPFGLAAIPEPTGSLLAGSVFCLWACWSGRGPRAA